VRNAEGGTAKMPRGPRAAGKKQNVANGCIWLHRDGAAGMEQKAAKNAKVGAGRSNAQAQRRGAAKEPSSIFGRWISAFVISPVRLLSLDACLLSSIVVNMRTISHGAA
jgi:hypothetical protein